MFRKRQCNRCGKKTSNSHDFCPNCGYSLKSKKKEDWGMLGKDDFENTQQQDPFEVLFGSFGGKMLGKMLTGTMKMLEKEMQKEIKKEPPMKTHIKVSINGKEIDLNNPYENKKPNKKEEHRVHLNKFSQNEKEKFLKLPKKEPSTNIRRLADKIIYELKMPGVKSIEDISINQLENSIEVKAVAKNKAYSKIIPINLPIINYFISKGSLILELNDN
ncbi:MAG: hypothetical protein ABH804_02100 [archaeon]